MGNRRIILELDREPQDLQAVWRLDSIARLIQQALFIGELNKPEVRAIKTKIPTLIGILTGLKTRSISSETIAAQIDVIIANQFGGYSCFFYETLFNQQLSPILVSRNKQQLIDIFNG